MRTTTVEQILEESPPDISLILYNHVRPIVRRWLKERRVSSIGSFYDDKKVREEQATAAIQAWLDENLSHLHVAQGLLALYMRSARAGIETHVFQDQGSFDAALRKHVRQIKQYTNGGLSQRAQTEIDKALRFSPEEAGLDLRRPLHLGMRHGALNVRDTNYPAVLQISRLKDPRRYGEKFTRRLCLGVLELGALEHIIGEDELERKTKVREALASMYDTGLPTPFDEQGSIEPERINNEGYLLMRAMVKDMLGIVHVAQNREQAQKLLQRMISCQYDRAWEYGILEETQLVQKNGVWQYERKLAIDNRIARGSEELAEGNRNIFLYAGKRGKTGPLIDMGFYGIADYLVDAIGGKGSHLTYEKKQEAKVKRWSRELQGLRRALLDAVLPILARVNLQEQVDGQPRYPVYK